MKNLKPLLACFLGTLSLAGCSEPIATGNVWTPLRASELDAAQEAQFARAEAAQGEMFGELVKTLMAEVASSGPAGAIGVCRDEAPRIAASTSERLGLEIGRTSWKLRNPANAAPAWAGELLADRPAEPRIARGPAGQLGVTLPIRVSAPCLACHGPEDSIPPDVRDALASLYPDDRATGFQSGDLRGWFWIEVPPETR